MKVKTVKSKTNSKKSSWDEENISDTAGNVDKKKKKSKNTTKLAESTPSKIAKAVKMKRKLKTEAGAGSSDEEFDASLDKLKAIDPEFYKVRRKQYDQQKINANMRLILKSSSWSKTIKNC